MSRLSQGNNYMRKKKMSIISSSLAKKMKVKEDKEIEIRINNKSSMSQEDISNKKINK